MQIQTRLLGPTDTAILDRIAVDVFDEPVDPKRLAAYLSAPGHFMIVALAGDVVVGQCAAVIHRHPEKPTELYIDEMGVTPSLWRQGIARRMLNEMFALGKSMGCGEAWVGTEHENAAAKGLYEGRGATGEPFVMYLYQL
jgi:ribosomal protein S18 acetylase RimI-like enzyme